MLGSQPCFSYDSCACRLYHSSCMGSKTSPRRALRRNPSILYITILPISYFFHKRCYSKVPSFFPPNSPSPWPSLTSRPNHYRKVPRRRQMISSSDLHAFASGFSSQQSASLEAILGSVPGVGFQQIFSPTPGTL